MRTKYTIAEAKAALSQYEALQVAHKIDASKLQAIIGDNKQANGLVSDSVKFSAPYRKAKSEVESAFYYLQCFAVAAGKELHGAMRYVENPIRYSGDKKYIKEG